MREGKGRETERVGGIEAQLVTSPAAGEKKRREGGRERGREEEREGESEREVGGGGEREK